jgi:hypothetical protein
MALVLRTVIIPKNTCLVRAAVVNDTKSTKRFFAFYGLSRKKSNYAQSKKFIKNYASILNTYEFHKTLKPLRLLNVPYLVISIYNEKEALRGFVLAYRLIKYLKQNSDLDIIKQYGFEKIASSVVNAIGLTMVGEDEFGEDIKLCRTKINQLIDYEHLVFHENPDYLFAKLICELDFNGWIRRGSDKVHTQADEVFVCNIKSLEKNGFIGQTEECNLDEI